MSDDICAFLRDPLRCKTDQELERFVLARSKLTVNQDPETGEGVLDSAPSAHFAVSTERVSDGLGLRRL